MQKPPMPISSGFSGFGNKRKRWDHDIPWLEFPDGKWINLRFFGDPESIVHMVSTHWLCTSKNKKRFPQMCLNFNSATGDYDKTGCPICDELDPFNSEIKMIKDASPKLSGFSHAIVRDIQAAGAITPDWKPWRPVRLPISILIALQKLKDRNIHTIDGKQYTADIADPYYGRDVSIMYDSSTSNPQQKYSIDKGDHTPLTEVELGYIKDLYKFENLIEYPDPQEIKKALTTNGYYQQLNVGGGFNPTDVPASAGQPLAPVPPAPPVPSAPAPAAAPAPKPISGGLGNAVDNVDLNSEEGIPFSPSEPAAAPIAAPAPAAPAKASLKETVEKYAEKIARAKPLKQCDKGDLAGEVVLACYGSYKGDMHCVRCPLRKSCLQA